MPDNIKKILIRGTNWIGDAVLTLPAIRSIRSSSPDAHISLLVKPWVSDVFQNNPDINEIILYDDSYAGLSGKLKLAAELRRRNFDTAILLQNAFDGALLARFAGIPRRTGYKRDGRGFLLTQAIPVSKDILSQHQVYYYLNLLKAIGMKTTETHPYMFLTDDERQWARNLIRSELHKGMSRHAAIRPLIGINPGATYGSAKRWLPERYAEVIRRIIIELNSSVMIFGSASEKEIADEILTHIDAPYHSFILNMAGKTTIRELASLIAECNAFITNDSGPMHIASALFVPVVGIFGSTDKTVTGPFGEGHRMISSDIPCSPCMKRECPEGHLQCMSDITADEVFSALKEVLPANKAVFLDRDGTVIEDKNYLNSFDNLVVFPDSKESLRKLRDAGFKLIGITNQSGIARGIIKESFVTELHAHLKKELGIDDFFYCPHLPDEHCPCRKPEAMLALKAKLLHSVNPEFSYMIGDKELDVQLAYKIGATGILLSPSQPSDTRASYVARDLTDAVQWILGRA
ncbi:MAG: lipopolysaccharide heptosyltransferase II [Nitrospiraceae bacterium]|nr:MAG: lipopolysaccharide heptosyltransferase II [Nitrospiraceae bacterium]